MGHAAKTKRRSAENPPTSAPLSRSDLTRKRLLESALDLFAAKGFDGVTTRELCAEASVNVAAIAYHFGGKKELYHALVRQMLVKSEPLVAPAIAALREGIRAARGDRDALTEITDRFVRSLIGAILADGKMRLRAAIIIREHAMPSDAYDIIYDLRAKPVHEAVAELVAAASGCPADSPETLVRAHAVIGQIIIFLIGRKVLWNRAGWDSYTPERIEMVGAIAAESVCAAIGLERSER
ncbi:MAG: CerR family C-terminal domain-containing protein [Rhodospirillales bacterium]|nr:CerR family C-terminal domain-containing protein [Rhodospirillales bacterium]MCW8970958.1 CerR family C-terminal domain-containing protein [Rhodospirillales bacterium]